MEGKKLHEILRPEGPSLCLEEFVVVTPWGAGTSFAGIYHCSLPKGHNGRHACAGLDLEVRRTKFQDTIETKG